MKHSQPLAAADTIQALATHVPMSDAQVDGVLATARRGLILQRAIGGGLLVAIFAGLVYFGMHGADDTLARLNAQGADILAMLLLVGLMYGLPILAVSTIYAVLTAKSIRMLVLDVRDAQGLALAGPAAMAQVQLLAKQYPPIAAALARWHGQPLRVREATRVFDAAAELARHPGITQAPA